VATEENAAVFVRGWVLVRVKIPTSPKIREKWGTQHSLHRCDGILQSGAVASGIAGAGWAEGSDLPVGKVAAQDGESGGAEDFG
jgi:hypothetical protein